MTGAPVHTPRRSKGYRFSPVGTVLARPRLFASVGVGLASYFILPGTWLEATRLLVAWNIGTWLYLVLASIMMARETAEEVRERALAQDESRLVILTFSLVAAAASFAATVMELASVKDMHGWVKAGHVGLVVATIVSAWTFIHLMFALHYAHEYAMQWRLHPDKPDNQRGGLNFPDTSAPDYGDFLYFSFVIGVASQTADVSVTSPSMRRLVVVHGIFAFFFNTTLLALTINIAAGLI